MKKFNILYIHTHDTGRHLNVYGCQTPGDELMAFARDSLVFRNGFCASPTCSPSRAALLTGCYPHANGMIGLTNRGFSIEDYSKHLVPFLNSNGYQTILCGIQHEAGTYLDHSFGASTIGYTEDITTEPPQGDMAEWDRQNAQAAAEYIARTKGDAPFFISVGFFATHREYPVETSFDSRYLAPAAQVFDNPENREDQARYLQSVKNFDGCFGKVIEALKKAGIYDRTIIIATTDHGLALPFQKCNLNDSGTGVYLMMRVPGGRFGETEENLTSHVDIFPTLCDLLALDKPKYLQGISFADTLLRQGRPPHRDYVFSEINFHTSYEPCRSARDKRYRYIKYYDTYPFINCSNIDNSPAKDFLLAHGLQKKNKVKEALYDLYFDPLEKENLIGVPEHSKTAERMRAVLRQWAEETGDEVHLHPIESFANHWKVNIPQAVDPKSKNPKDFY